ncbi:hypothetical protein I4U23_016804 [Adineta vaga]|nr:hypothetical protein I4U23_016804 [Adineta vaga]
MIRTVEKTEYAPSPAKFLQLSHNYPNTLRCPCFKAGIMYDTFSTDDFRVTLSFFWQIVAGLCVASESSWNNAVASFRASHILTPTAMVEDFIRTQVQTALNNQIVLSQATLARNLLAIRRMTSGNQIASGLQTNFYLRYPPEGLGSQLSTIMTPRMFNDCSCLKIEGCPRPATFKDSHWSPAVSTAIEWKPRPIAGELIPFHIVRGRVQYLQNYVQQTIVSLNLFEKPTPRIPINIYREQLLTRVFILLITTFSITVGFYIFFVERNQVVTITHPSLATYQQLYNDHPTTLQCPCSQISVPYKAFLNVTFVIHQICSSGLVSPVWLNYLTLFDPTHDQHGQITIINIADAQRIFTGTQFINDRVLAPPLFAQQTQDIIDSFINTTRNNFVRTFDWINIAFITSQFFTGGNINCQAYETDDDYLHVEYTVYVLYTEITSTGMYSGFLSSKGEWWYNITYLEYIRETYSIVINSQSPPDIKSLNASIPTHFENVTTIDLIREMLLETSKTNNTRFDQFYNECAPLASICGGLNKGFQILVPLFGKLLLSWVDWCKTRHIRRVQPSMSARLKHLTPAAFAQTLDLVRTTAQGNALLAMFSSNWDLLVAEKGQGRNAVFLTAPVIHNNIEQNTSCSCATLRTCTIPLEIVGLFSTAIADGMPREKR